MHAEKTFKSAGIAFVSAAIFCISYCNKNTDPLKPQSPIPGIDLTVITPNGDSIYYIDDTMKITWEMRNSISGLVIDFSPNGGHNYFCIAGEFFPGDTEFQNREFFWAIPDTVTAGINKMSTFSDSCRIFIHDYFNYPGGDISDKLFSIHKR